MTHRQRMQGHERVVELIRTGMDVYAAETQAQREIEPTSTNPTLETCVRCGRTWHYSVGFCCGVPFTR